MPEPATAPRTWDKVLVTGGGGFLGGALVRRLRREGCTVRTFSRGHYPELDSLGAEQKRGDLADREAVEAAVSGCELVFHVGGKTGIWGAPEEFERANVRGASNVVQACLRTGCRWLIYTSSPSVVFAGDDLEGVDESIPLATRFSSDYPRTKALAEREILAAADTDLHTLALRPHLVWGPGDRHILPGLLERARAGQLRRLGTRPLMVDFTYIDNAVEAEIRAAGALLAHPELSGRVYFISDDHPVDLWEFINQLLEACDAPRVTKSAPPWLARVAGSVLESAHRIFRRQGQPRLTRFLAEQLSTAHWFDISAAKRELGYRPLVTPEEGLKRLGARGER